MISISMTGPLQLDYLLFSHLTNLIYFLSSCGKVKCLILITILSHLGEIYIQLYRRVGKNSY